MKRSIFIVFILLLGIFCTYAEEVEVKLESLPATIEEFIALRDDIGDSPEGGAVAFIVAMMLYSENRELGLQAFTIMLDREQLTAGNVYRGFKPRRPWDDKFAQLDKFPYLGRVYVQGTRSADGYQLAGAPHSFVFSELRKLTESSFKVFVKTTSGNWSRPLTLVKNNRGYWKVSEASSMFVGVVETPPEDDTIDDDL